MRLKALGLNVLFASILIGCQAQEPKQGPKLVPLDVSLTVSFDRTDLPTDSLLTISFVWETQKTFSPLDKDLWVFVHFKDGDGKMLWQADHRPEPPMPKWRPSQLVKYNRTVYVPPILEKTVANVFVGLYYIRTSKTRYVVSGAAPAPEKPWALNVGLLNVQPRPSLLESPSRANLALESGFFPVETEGTQQWRWTGKEAQARLQRIGERGILFLEGEVNLKCLKALPSITVSLAGEARANFSPDPDTGMFQRTLIVMDDDFGDSRWLAMKIETSQTFVPSQCAEGLDNRELGIRLHRIYFGPVGP